MSNCRHFRYTAQTPRIRELGLGVAALEYISIGFSVLPLARGGKRPHPCLGASGGVHHATRDVGQIGRWWTADPLATVGVATGVPSALVVIDLDVKNGEDGRVSLGDWLRSWGGQLPYPAPAAATPSGGMHIYLRTPPGATVPERPGALPGVDVKGDGGYVVAPPSVSLRVPLARPGEAAAGPVPVPYRWAAGCPCTAPPAPDWIPGWLASMPDRGVSGSGGGGEASGYLPPTQELIEQGVEPGRHDSTLAPLCARLYAGGSTESEAHAVWRVVADRIQDPVRPFTYVDFHRHWRGGVAFVDRQRMREMEMRRTWLEHIRR